MKEQPVFPAVLQRALDESGMKAYGLAANSKVSASTICKIFNYEKYKRRVTEAQVLRFFVGLVLDESRRREILDLLHVKDAVFFNKLDELLESRKMTCAQLAIVASVGAERLEEGRSGRRPLQEALKLRLLIEACCKPVEIRDANVLLQAGDFRILGGGSDDVRRVA
jgi:hypothetical protein